MTWWVGLKEFNCRKAVDSNGRCNSQYTRKYLVRTDEPILQNEDQVLTAVGIDRGSPLDFNTNAICMSCAVDPVEVMTKPPWQAFYATYDFATNAPLPENDDDDPMTSRTIWSISPQIQSRYIIKDRHGKLIVTAAGTPVSVPVDVRLGSVTARRSIDAAGYDVNSVLGNSGKVNSQTFLGGAPGTVQVDIYSDERYEGGFHFWEERFVFSYDPLGWQPRPANADLWHLFNDERRRILNSDVGDTVDPTSPVQEPEPLDADGFIVPHEDRPDSCTFIEVDYFEEMDFNTFDL